MNAPSRVAFLTILVLAAFCMAMLVRAVSARAHDWYPADCCSNMDCAPVEKADIVSSPFMAGLADSLVPPAHAGLGAMAVTTKHGTVIVPANFPRRESKDGQLHACMRPGANGAMRLICIFLPPAS